MYESSEESSQMIGSCDSAPSPPTPVLTAAMRQYTTKLKPVQLRAPGLMKYCPLGEAGSYLRISAHEPALKLNAFALLAVSTSSLCDWNSFSSASRCAYAPAGVVHRIEVSDIHTVSTQFVDPSRTVGEWSKVEKCFPITVT
eukprot:2298890-Rhodomonas_salina.1